MYSAEKEEIELVNEVDPNDKKVEYWMGEIQDAMFMTVREVLKYSVLDYTERSRNEWIKKHPGQCVLNGSQIHWTKDVEAGFADGGARGVEKVVK
jgi:dynein heavy chain